MKKILYALQETRCEQLKTSGEEHRIQEVRDLFGFVDGALSGVGLGGANHNTWDAPYTKLSEAMVTGDFTYALTEFVQRQMVPGYETRNFAFEPLVKAVTVPNYLDVTRYQDRGDMDDLEYVPPKGEPMAGSKNDATKRQYKVEVWSKQWDWDNRAIINDDMDYFKDTGMQIGQSARRTIERFVSRMYNNVTSIGRLTTLGALYSTTGRLTHNRISTSRMAFAQRVNDNANPILGSLGYIVIPLALQDTVLTIQNSELVPELATNAVNVVAGKFETIVDPHIAVTFGSGNNPWWGFVRWQENNIVPLILARRDGMAAPLLARKKSDIESYTSFAASGAPMSPLLGDFATGNIVLKVHDEWGTYIDGTEGNLNDYRGAYYSAGTAP